MMQTHEKSPVGAATPNKANELTQKHYTLSDEESQVYIKDSYKFKEILALQKLPLDMKIAVSVTVIGQALTLGHAPAVAFSGGKDSQVVADLIERFFHDDFKRVHCIFGNTGIEFPESLRFAREYGREHCEGDVMTDIAYIIESADVRTCVSRTPAPNFLTWSLNLWRR